MILLFCTRGLTAGRILSISRSHRSECNGSDCAAGNHGHADPEGGRDKRKRDETDKRIRRVNPGKTRFRPVKHASRPICGQDHGAGAYRVNEDELDEHQIRIRLTGQSNLKCEVKRTQDGCQSGDAEHVADGGRRAASFRDHSQHHNDCRNNQRPL